MSRRNLPLQEVLSTIPLVPKYRNWFLGMADTFTRVDMDESRRLASHCKIRQCYANCARNSIGRAVYHEGFVLFPSVGMWVRHAFLVSDGAVVDPTLAIKNRIEDGAIYLGVPFPDALAIMARKKRFEPLLDYKYLAGKNSEPAP